jgi:toxin-antitoxin system PIN domain toxin
MQRSLVDVNLWFALLVRQHQHHGLAHKWFDTLGPAEAGMCRMVQLALMRLLANRTILGEHAISAAKGWTLLEELAVDERVEFLREPEDLPAVFPSLLNYPVPTGKLVADAYLAAFAISGSLRLVTLDRGFRQYRGLEAEILGAR